MFISGVSDANSSSSLDHCAVLCYLNMNRHLKKNLYNLELLEIYQCMITEMM